ncbi:nitrate reductase associated protein [Oscillatoriales cyanobacterium USR001]|nr:nitrate reductase associated protein [Oscillatoriales cyanobacterium USR001]
MNYYFQFESEFVTDLRCIPMLVRYKLDTCGVKLKLSHWNQFSQEERQELVEKDCTKPEEIQAYRDWLQQLVIKYTNNPASELAIELHPAWMNAANIPDIVQEKSEEMGIKLTVEQWQLLTPVQRFALIKLSRPSHENKNFLPALQEFNL